MKMKNRFRSFFIAFNVFSMNFLRWIEWSENIEEYVKKKFKIVKKWKSTDRHSTEPINIFNLILKLILTRFNQKMCTISSLLCIPIEPIFSQIESMKFVNVLSTFSQHFKNILRMKHLPTLYQSLSAFDVINLEIITVEQFWFHTMYAMNAFLILLFKKKKKNSSNQKRN